jgi:RNA polymerase sigma factor FliA
MTTLTSSDQNALVLQTVDLVGHIVAELSARYPKHVDRSELWNAGVLGLVEASRRFDPESGVPFARYAAIRIRGAIIDSTRSRDWATRSVRKGLREIHQAIKGWETANGRTPSTAELASVLGVDAEELARRSSQENLATLLHLDHRAEGEESTLADRVEEPAPELVPDIALERRELRGTLASAVRNLPVAQAQVISRYYIDAELLQHIADDMGLTEARVSQIRSEALEALRAFFATQYDGVEPAVEEAPGKRARAAYLERMSTQSHWLGRFESASFLDAAVAGLAPLVDQP